MRPSRWDEWREPGFVPECESSGLRRAASIPSDERRHERRSLYEPVPRRHTPEDAVVLMPLFPVGYFTPSSPCPHAGPIPDGSALVCMVCHDTGMRNLSCLGESAKEALRLKNWKPPEDGDDWSDGDQAESAEPTRYEGRQRPKTRKQRRADARGNGPI